MGILNRTEQADMTPDDINNARTLLELIGNTGTVVTISSDRLRQAIIEARDEDGQAYRIVGDNVYHCAVELAKQLGFEDLD